MQSITKTLTGLVLLEAATALSVQSNNVNVHATGTVAQTEKLRFTNGGTKSIFINWQSPQALWL